MHVIIIIYLFFYFKDTKAEIGFLDGQTDLFDYTSPVGKCLRNDHPTSSAWTIRVAEIEEKSINLFYSELCDFH